jgi:hypothetical protein
MKDDVLDYLFDITENMDIHAHASESFYDPLSDMEPKIGVDVLIKVAAINENIQH